MDDLTMSNVIERLTQLEEENRRLSRESRRMRRYVRLASLGIVAAVATGAGALVNPQLQPGRIIVVDPQGSQAAIELKASGNGVYLHMRDEAGAKRVDIGSGPQGQGIRFYDAHGNPGPGL